MPTGVYVLPNYSHLVSGSYLDITGEVYNGTENNISFVKVIVDFFDGNGQFIDTSTRYVCRDTIPSGQKGSFEFYISQPQNWSRYEFEAPTYYIDSAALPVLILLSATGRYVSGSYEIVGQVRNDDVAAVTSVQLAGTLYDTGAKVVGSDCVYGGNSTLAPGQTTSFKLSFWPVPANVTTFTVLTAGNPQ
jgi:hypothetical protein